MTTPERLRARQIQTGVVLILLGIFTVLQAIVFNLEDRQQRTCLEDNFIALNNALEVRADLAARETKLQHNVWSVYARAAGLLKDDPNEKLSPRDRKQLQREWVAALLEYDEGIQEIQRERRENPVPPYPVGSCE